MDKELPVSAWPEWKIIEKIGAEGRDQIFIEIASAWWLMCHGG